MKKGVALFLAVIMAISLVPVFTAVNAKGGTPSENLFIGGDFNDPSRGVGYFKADYQTECLVYLPNGGEDGSGCVGIQLSEKVEDGGLAYICMRYDAGNGYSLPLYPGNTYTMSFKLKNPKESGITWMNMGIEGFEKFASGAHWALAATMVQDGWVTVSQTFTVPESPENTCFRIYGGYSSNPGNVMVLIDDVSIVDVTPDDGNLFIGGNFNNPSLGLGYFESHRDSIARATYLTDGGIDNSGCFGLIVPANSWNGSDHQDISMVYNNGVGSYSMPVAPGNTYKLSCDVYKPDNSLEWLNLRMLGIDSVVFTNAMNRWDHLEMTFRVPAGCYALDLQIDGGTRNNTDADTIVKIDNLSLTDITPYSENLLIGGDMNSEDLVNTCYTITYDGGVRTWLADRGTKGTGCLALSVNGAGMNNALITEIYPGMPLEVGKTYTVSCDIFIPKNTLQVAWIDFEAGDTDDFDCRLNAWEDGLSFPWNYRTGAWQRLQSTFVYDGYARGLRIFGMSCENPNTNAQILIDNLSLRCTDTGVQTVASIRGIPYPSLDAAYAAVAPDQMISLEKDITVPGLMTVPANVTIDLNGHTLTTDNLFSFGNVVDSSHGRGGVKISNDRTKAFVQLQETNTALPLYDSANGCYRFVDYTLQFKVKTVRESYTKYAVRIELPSNEAYGWLADPVNADLIRIHLEMVRKDGKTQQFDYLFLDSTIRTYAERSIASSKPQAIVLTVRGLDAQKGLDITADAYLRTATGVTAEFEPVYDFDRAVNWVETQIENDTLFSFGYNGQAYEDHIGQWEKTVERTDAGWTVTYKNGNVVAWTEIALNPTMASVEWTSYFKNNGNSNSPAIRDVRAIDSPVWVENPVLTTANGSTASATDFQSYSVDLATRSHSVATTGGRSSEGAFPYFEISNGRYGVMGGIGWTGNWNASFQYVNGDAWVDAGMQRINTVLYAGEQMRTPMVMLQFYNGDSNAGHNALRQLILEDYTPTDASGNTLEHGMFYNSVVDRAGQGEDVMLNAVKENDGYGVSYEMLWIDAGWFGDKKGNNNCTDGTWIRQVGNWYFIPSAFRDNNGNGVRDIQRLSQYVKSQGKDVLLWMEPERVYSGNFVYSASKLYNENKNNGYLLTSNADTSKLWNFANDNARDYMINLVCDIIQENGVTWYRQDLNAIGPDHSWAYADTTDRIGMTEVKYITNLYYFFDALVERNPGLMIDNCAQGGRRLDLEMMKRSVPLWNSDYGTSSDSTPDGIRSVNYNLTQWLPIHGGAYPVHNHEDNTDYRFRVTMNSAMGFDMGNAPHARNQQLIQEYYTCRELMNGSYYVLAAGKDGAIETADACYEFYKAEEGKGYLLAFRPEACEYATGLYTLKGLDSNAKYEITSADTGQKRIYTGAHLMNNGLTVQYPQANTAYLFYITRK